MASPSSPGAVLTFIRKYSTQATTALGLVVLVTGVMLFYRLGKAQVTPMHEWLGLIFVGAVLLHVVRHWQGFTAMLNQPRMMVLGAVTLIAAAGFLYQAQTPGGARGGNPMRGVMQMMEQASLHDLAPVLKISETDAQTRLEKAGITASDTTQTLGAIARANGTETMRVIGALTGAGAPPGGPGAEGGPRPMRE